MITTLYRKKTYTPKIIIALTFSYMLVTLMATGNLYAQTYMTESRLTASDGESSDRFGTSVGMDGFWAVIGAPGDAGENNAFSNQGAVYFYLYNINGWVEHQKINTDAVADLNFGEAAAISGNSAIIGAPGTLGETDTIPGRAYIFRNDDDNWAETQELLPESKSFYFGKSVDIDGDYIVIGTPATSSTDTGTVYIYKKKGSNWELQTRLIASDAYFGDQFGRSVSISGTRVIVGSNNEAAYVFKLDSNSWKEEQKLTISEPYVNYDQFGRTVALHKNTAIVGSYRNDENSNVYVFQYEDSTWIQQDKLYHTIDTFGHALALNDNMLVVGTYAWSLDYVNGGYVSAYRYINGFWTPTGIIPGNLDESWEENLYFGYSVDVCNGTIIGGAPLRNTWTGAAYIHELSARPDEVTVSNGAFNNRNKISWNNDTGESISGFKIYRELDLIDSTTTAARANYDYDGIAGKLHSYGVSAIGVDWGESLPAYSLGWQTANGKMGGTVKTAYGGSIDSVEIEINSIDGPLGSCLEFNSTDDYVIMYPHDTFPTTLVTVSFWMKTDDQGNTHPFSYATPGLDNSFLVANPSNLTIWIGAGETEDYVRTGISINDGYWHHLAITWQSSDGEINLFKDGEIKFTGIIQTGNSIYQGGSLVFGQDQENVGGGFDPNQAYGGLLDEVRLWKSVRDPNDIQNDMYRSLKGDEQDLVSYWSFDDLSGRAPQGIAGDYAKNSGQHGKIYGAVYSREAGPVRENSLTDNNGAYTIENIYYGEERQFELSPFKDGHLFDPANQSVVISPNTPEHLSIDFIDTTALTIAGRIEFSGTNCPVPNVEILLDDKETGEFTDADGMFQLTIDEPKIYNIKPVLGATSFAHTFDPPVINLDVQKNELGIQFKNTTYRLLSGKFGAPCEADIGTAEIVITSIGNNAGCFKKTILTDARGYYSVLLPAQPYEVDIKDVDTADPNFDDIVLRFLNPDTVDLTWTDTEHNFTYRNKPIIRISGWPQFGGGEYNVPIMDQGNIYDLKIEIMDVWEGDTCRVNQGTVKIYDKISGISDEPQTAILDSGEVIYRCIPGEPNLLTGSGHSYQKDFFVVARVGEQRSDSTQWAVIVGAKSREAEFYTMATPEMPFWVLNDPPGDNSFAYFAKDSTYSTTIRNTYNYQSGDGEFVDLRPGVVVSIGFQAGWFSMSTDVGIYGIVDFSKHRGLDTSHTYTKVVTFTTSQEFSTSNMDNIVGEEGDLYIGASFNDEFALADILEFDWDSNTVDRDTALVYLRTNFETDFVYTESHIVNFLIPKLKELARLDPDKTTNYNAQIKIWQQKIEENHRLKEQDNPNTQLHKNWTFSAGPSITETYTTHPTDTTWAGYNKSTFEYEGKFGGGIVFLGCSYEGGYNKKIQSEVGDESETSIKTSETYGYTLADDDPGDNFTVDVNYQFNTLSDGSTEIFGPPIFTLVSGQSSNPWERGTQARDGVSLALNKYEIYNVPPDDPAPFILFLGNTSESGEEREYHLSVIQQSNLDGAIIRVGGVVIEDHLSYTIPAGEQLTATLSVDRGPIAYDYENLQVKFYAPGDEETIADTVTFSIHYISPCSDVNLVLPENNWLVNASHHDTLQFVIDNYDINNPHLESVILEYRRVGDSWKTPFTYLKSELPSNFIMGYWNLNELPDGNYELRAMSDCGTLGVKYSTIASGVIDRKALIVFGTPEPADGVLNLGEDISISFSGEIDPALLASKSASLITVDDSVIIEVDISAYENKLIITPQENLSQYEDRLLIATVSGIMDIHGNILRQAAHWTFRVNQSPVYWTVPNVDYTVYQGAEESLMRILKNAGGTDEAYTIVSHPQWLIPDILNGTIPSSGEKAITFSVNTQLNVATYRDTVVVITSYGEERLLVILNVLHEPPKWQVNPASYTHNMNITTQVVFDDTLSRDIFDIIGVYSGNEMRGVALIEYVAVLNKYVAFITVYSNQTDGEMLTFRMWDASVGKEYAFFGSNYSFTSNSSLGTVSTPLILRPDATVQVIELNPGWTWFSLNVDNGFLPLDKALINLSPSEGDLIKGQNVFSQYSENYGWQGWLAELTIASSYQIFLKNGGTLQCIGAPVEPSQATMNIREGWNWIAHLNRKIKDLNETLLNFPAISGDRIKSQTEFADFVSATQTWEGSLKQMTPGQGYLLKSGQEIDFQYPVLGKIAFSYPAIPEWEIDINAFEYTMSVTVVIEFDAMEMEDSTLIIGAFSGYECRGLTQIRYVPGLNKYIGFLPVFSTTASGDSVNFEVFEPESDKIRPITEKIAFVSDMVVGDLDAPYVLTAQPVGDELVPKQYYLGQNYPNPFNPETIIEYGLSVDGDVELVVFNILGQKVATLVNERQEAHHYKITFNAADHMLASGVYFYQLKSGNFIKSHKLLFLK